MISLPMHYWSMICLAVAMLFLTLELFIPSAGMFGLIAALLIVTSIVTGFWYHLIFGGTILLLILVATPFLISLATRIWPHTPIGKRILIGDRDEDDVLPKGSHYKKISQQSGQTGIAKTKMYPSGIVLIDDEPFDAVTNGFPVDAGDKVRVISVDGNRLRVQKIDDEDEVGNWADGAPDAANGKNPLSQTMEDLGIESFDLGASTASDTNETRENDF